MGRKVDKECTCCTRNSKKRKHGDSCPVCGGKLKAKSGNPVNLEMKKFLKKKGD